jgi:hypothetical protein
MFWQNIVQNNKLKRKEAVKASVKFTCLWAEIWTWNVLNMKQDCKLLNNVWFHDGK